MREHTKHNQRGYDRWALTYDDTANPTVAIDDRTFPRVYDRLPTGAALDLGCGTGRHTERLLQLGHQVTGLDVSESMLAQARDKLAGTDCILITHDLHHPLPFGDGTFDLVVASLVLEHIHPINPVFSEVARILRPRGSFCISEIHPVRAQSGHTARFFDVESSCETRLASFSHSELDPIHAGLDARLMLADLVEVMGDDALAGIAPTWSKYAGHPMLVQYRFVKPAQGVYG